MFIQYIYMLLLEVVIYDIIYKFICLYKYNYILITKYIFIISQKSDISFIIVNNYYFYSTLVIMLIWMLVLLIITVRVSRCVDVREGHHKPWAGRREGGGGVWCCAVQDRRPREPLWSAVSGGSRQGSAGLQGEVRPVPVALLSVRCLYVFDMSVLVFLGWKLPGISVWVRRMEESLSGWS